MTSSFHVNLHGMASLWSKNEQLANLSDTIRQRVRKYAMPELGSAGTGMYIDILQPGLKNVWDQAQSFAGGTAQVIDHYGKNLQAARLLYASSDAKAGAGFDALIDDIGAPDGQALAGRPKPDPKSTADDLGCTWPVDPVIRDGAPQSNPKFSFEFNHNTGDFLKITAYVRLAFQKAFGGDPVAFFMKPFIGDWDALWKSSVEFERYAKSFKAIGTNLQFLSDQIPAVWDGNAANNAREQMLALGRKIAAAEPDFTAAAKAFQTAANDAWTAFQFTADKVTDAIDLMIPIAGEINAGKTITKETAAVINQITGIYKALTHAGGELDKVIKKVEAVPESLSVPPPKIKGYSVAIGGWFKSSKQGPVAPVG